MDRFRPTVCPDLIGRDRELRYLLDLLESVRSGAGSAALITGDPGIGKSRLASELAHAAQNESWTTVRAGAVEPLQSLPFGLVRDILKQISPADQYARELLGSLGNRQEHVLHSGRHETTIAECVDVLEEFSSRQPTLIVLDDLHWADSASLAVVALLVRRIERIPLLLLLTSRGTDSPAHIRRLLDDLWRTRLLARISLTELDPPDVSRMIQATFALGRPPHPTFVETLARLTGGVPFFVEELLATLVAGGDIFPVAGSWNRKPLDEMRIPGSIEGVLMSRFELLSEIERNVLKLAAVIGPSIQTDLLQSCAELDEMALIEHLQRLVNAQLLVEESARTFAFRHALIQWAVASTMLARERQSLHLQVRDTLLRLRPEEDALDALVYHSFHAEHWREVIRYGERAASRAEAMHDAATAFEHYRRMAVAYDATGTAPPIELHLGRGRCAEIVGEIEEARAQFEHANLRAEREERRDLEQQALLALGFLWTATDAQKARGYLDASLQLARGIGEPRSLSQSLNRVGNWLTNDGSSELAIPYHEEALKIATTAELIEEQAASLDMLSMALVQDGRTLESIEASRCAYALFEQCGNQRGMVGIQFLGQMLPIGLGEGLAIPANGTPRQGADLCHEAARRSRELRWSSMEAFHLAVAGECETAMGNFAAAENVLGEALRLAESLGHTEWTIQALFGLADFAIAIFDFAAVPAIALHIEELSSQMGSRLWADFGRVLAGMAAARNDNVALADELIQRGFDEDSPMQTLRQRLWWTAIVERDLAAGAYERAGALLDRMVGVHPGVPVADSMPWLALLKARSLAGLGAVDDSMSAAEQVLAVARSAGLRPIEIRTLALLVMLRRGMGQHEAAGELRDRAQAVIEAVLVDTPAEHHARVRHGFESTLPQPTRKPLDDSSMLSARELEIARLVVTGETNRAIGERLFISERTVESHVSNIMRKLGVRRRSLIASGLPD